jgi:hypothetical protein
MSNEPDPNLAVTVTPILPSDQERAAVALMTERLNDEAAINRRLAAIERDATELRAIRDDSEILAKSERLAQASIAAIERKAETTEE